MFIQNLIDRLFNYNNIKQQYDPEIIRKREKVSSKLNLSNKKEIDKATKHLNNEMDEAAKEFYNTKKNKEKDDGLSL